MTTAYFRVETTYLRSFLSPPWETPDPITDHASTASATPQVSSGMVIARVGHHGPTSRLAYITACRHCSHGHGCHSGPFHGAGLAHITTSRSNDTWYQCVLPLGEELHQIVSKTGATSFFETSPGTYFLLTSYVHTYFLLNSLFAYLLLTHLPITHFTWFYLICCK